jgi:hypothetical protein
VKKINKPRKSKARIIFSTQLFQVEILVGVRASLARLVGCFWLNLHFLCWQKVAGWSFLGGWGLAAGGLVPNLLLNCFHQRENLFIFVILL